jgi:TonB family protein
MLPRALLFSSDEQATKVLQELLSELHVEITCCREIFAAVEELTSRNFQIILIDWGQELEASFLFNMARELKTTRHTHTVVVVDAQLAPVLVVNPDGFLEKPFSAEQARRVLLQSPPFRQLADTSAPAPVLVSGIAFEDAVQSGDDSSNGTQSHTSLNNEDGHATPRIAATLGSRERTDRRYKVALLEHRGMRREMSTAKKTVALACLVLLLIAVVHGERQLGYIPAGFFGYREIAKLLFSPQKNLPDRSPEASWQVKAQPMVEADGISGQDFDTRNYSRHIAGPISVRPIFGQGFSSLQGSARPLAQLMEGESPTGPLVPQGPSGANPLIPSSLYRSPQLIFFLGASPQTAIGASNWSTGPIVIPEETSRTFLIHQVLPSYPLEALRAGLQGTVVLQALVGRDGSVEDLKLVQGYFALGNAAIHAVKQWRFRPYRLNGEAVEVQTLLTLTFPLNSDPQKRASSDGSLITYGAWK